MSTRFRQALAIGNLGLGALVIPGTASPRPPGNDDFANAVVVDPARCRSKTRGDR